MKIAAVSFIPNGKVYYFDSKDLILKKKLTVIVETERGIQFGTIEDPNIKIDCEKIKENLKSVIRIATKQDYLKHLQNEKDAKEVIDKSKELIAKYNLNMTLVDASYTFDRSQLMIKYTADSRVDFRDLVKELAFIYKTRIELRQIGVRDKAKEIGGLGLCGRELCCHNFLHDMEAVSINMAKNQNIALNPNKINGCCGRLLCCLKYEDLVYEENKKELPDIGEKLNTKYGKGIVIGLDILRKKYTVEIENGEKVEMSIEKNDDKEQIA